MSDERKGFVELVSGVLRRPRETFQYVRQDDLTRGLAIVLVTVVLAVVSSMQYMSKIPLDVLVPQLSETGVDASQIGGSMGLFTGIGVAISILIGYALSTLIMHGVATLLGGGGNMKRFFAMHGFAATPHALNYLVRVVDAYTINSSALTGYFIANREVGNRILRAALNTNLFTVFGLAVLVYLTYAVAENYQLDRKKAFIVALLPYLLYVMVNMLSPAG